MNKKRAKRHMELSAPIKTVLGILFPCLIGVFISILLSIFFSYILSKSPEISKSISLYFIISVLSGAFTCGFTASKLLNCKGLFSGLICSLPFSFVILSIMLLASDGNLSASSLIIICLIILLCVFGGIVSSNMKRRK